MKAIVILALLLLSAVTAHPQSRGFYYSVMNTDDTSYPTLATSAVETSDGDYLVFATDFFSPGVIYRFSQSGEVTKTVELSENGRNALLFNMMPDPHDSTMFYGVCEMWDDMESEESLSIVHFGESLESIEYTPVVLPQNIGMIRVTASMIDSSDRFFIAARHYSPVDICYGFIFMTISMTGEVENLTTMEDSIYTFVRTVFEYPDGTGTLGAYEAKRRTLYRFNEDLDFTTRVLADSAFINEQDSTFNHIVFSDLDTNGGLVVFPDGTYGICDAVDERWYRPNQWVPYKRDYSVSMQWLDEDMILEGVTISQERTLGNDIHERPAEYKSIDYKDPDAVFTCSFNETFVESISPIYQDGAVVVMKTDRNHEKIWDKVYHLGPYLYIAASIQATNDGGCLVLGRSCNLMAWPEKQGFFVLKVNADGTLGTDEVFVTDRDAVVAYPNPTNGKITLADGQFVEADVFSVSGQCMIAEKCHYGHSLVLDLENLPAGLYFLRVTDKNGHTYTQKVIKE